MNQVPIIDYDSHPAFAGLAAPYASDLDERVAAVEESYVQAAAASTMATRQEVFDRTVRPQVDDLVEAIQRDPALGIQARTYVRSAFARAGQLLRARLDEDGDSRNLGNSAAAAIRGELLPIFDGMRRDGFCEVAAGSDLARLVWRTTPLERAIMRRRARKNPTRHCAFPLSSYSPAARAVCAAVERLGILDVASAYMNRPMMLGYVSLEMGHAGQVWYRDCYKDRGIATTKTAYMHFDADRGMLKAVMYLKDVAPQNGPFSYIPGSHRWQRPALASAVQSGFDHAQAEFSEVDDGGLDYVGGYYRPRFADPAGRKAMLALPRALRGSTHFGDDILDGTELSNELLKQEHVFTAPAGMLLLFDGSQGVHRGSMVREGERWALQLGFYPRDNARPEPSALETGLRYLKHCAGNLVRLARLR